MGLIPAPHLEGRAELAVFLHIVIDVKASLKPCPVVILTRGAAVYWQHWQKDDTHRLNLASLTRHKAP